MISVVKSFNFERSSERIEAILDANDNSFTEVSSIPNTNDLTFINGFYVNCTALFIDIRNSSKLPDKYRRPRLAKIYRVYLSEMVAVMNSNDDCKEIRIVGDCVSGIFNTPYGLYIDDVFSTAAKMLSTIETINFYFENRGIDSIKVGVGIDYGRALMIKAGFNGSGINDIVWMGDVVNSASNLCSYGSSTYSDDPLMVSKTVYANLNENNQSLLKYNIGRDCYHGNIINTGMKNSLKAIRGY